MNYPDTVVSVDVIEYLKLHVRFQDGTEGIVIFEPGALQNVFEPLRKQDVFNQVHCKDGCVTWTGELDIAPDAMYQQIKSTGKMIIKSIANTHTNH